MVLGIGKEQIKDVEQRDLTVSEAELNSRQKLVARKTSVAEQQQQFSEIYQKLIEIVNNSRQILKD